MDNLNPLFATISEWQAANPLLIWRNASAQNLPTPVETDTAPEPRPAVPQEDVAKACDVSRSAVHYWETGKFMPNFRVCQKLAALMGQDDTLRFYNNWEAWRSAKPADVQPVAAN